MFNLVAVQKAEMERDESKLTMYLHDLKQFFIAQVRSQGPSCSAVLTLEFLIDDSRTIRQLCMYW